jgi:hypothetical protein
MEEDVEAGYRFLASVLFLLIALPLAGYALFPDNYYASFISYPPRLLLVPIHELGHMILIFATQLLNLPYNYMNIPITMAGSFFEILVPLIFVIFLLFGSQRYALACLLIVVLGAAVNDTGRYIQSASSPTGTGLTQFMEVTAITPESHDWFRILSYFNALDQADILGELLIDLGFVLILVGFFSSVFEVNLVLNYRKSSDFMLLMFYGSIPTILLSIAYFKLFRIIFSILFFTPSLIHFYTTVLPKLKEEVKEVDREIEDEDEETAAKSKTAREV